MKNLSIKMIAAVALATLSFNPAYSKNEKHGNNGKNKHSHEKHHADRPAKFSSHDRDIIVTYLNNNNVQVKKCPPGLAKKNPLCMPPGQYKKLVVGQPLTSDITWGRLPNGLLAQLPPPPANAYYGMVGNDVLLLSDKTRIILDIISLIAR